MLRLSRSVRRKLLATGLAAGVFTLLYQATVFDSLKVGDTPSNVVKPLGVGSRTAFEATAYCRGEVTAAGIAVRAGMAASDPAVLPLGSTIQIDFDRKTSKYKGIYTVLDTGPEIQGREVDLYMWNCDEAVEFGRQKVMVTVMRRGWVSGEPRR
jgi:3D (Asp-Asp-Asp) domain-containing protein